MFNDFFYSVFAKSSNSNESTDNSDQTCTLHDISISTTEIFETLITLDPNKASGIDNISPRVLKFSALPLSSPICHLFQQCLFRVTYLRSGVLTVLFLFINLAIKH